MFRWLTITNLLFFIGGLQAIVGQSSCPDPTHMVVSKFVISAAPDASLDSVQKLPQCLGLQSCQMTSVQWGQCGSAKVQKIEGAEKAAIISLSPAGCTEVYNCNGILVDSETYNAVRSVGVNQEPRSFQDWTLFSRKTVLPPNSVGW